MRRVCLQPGLDHDIRIRNGCCHCIGCVRTDTPHNSIARSPSFEIAPNQKKSMSDSTATAATAPAVALSLTVRFFIKTFFSCSNTVYCELWFKTNTSHSPVLHTCRMGFITRTSAGPKPRQNAPTPSLRKMNLTVSIMLSLRGSGVLMCADGFARSEGNVCVACVTCVTHIGFEMTVVAVPAKH